VFGAADVAGPASSAAIAGALADEVSWLGAAAPKRPWAGDSIGGTPAAVKHAEVLTAERAASASAFVFDSSA